MSFKMPVYHAPDFEALGLQNGPEVCMAPAPMDGVAPENYHATGIYPEYVHIEGCCIHRSIRCERCKWSHPYNYQTR